MTYNRAISSIGAGPFPKGAAFSVPNFRRRIVRDDDDVERTGFSVHDPVMPMEVATGFGKPEVLSAHVDRGRALFVIKGTPTACLNKARQIGAAAFGKPWHFTTIEFAPIRPEDLDITEIDKLPYHGWIFSASAEIDGSEKS